MATDDVNIAEDADMAECDGDKVVTMMDVLQEQQDFEEDANAVLGASDDKNCTYSKGYIKRQALYACLTCCTEANVDPTKRAGVCLACSLSCHENHELIELYTKRNFRCDCGNPKFNSHPCQFTPDKADLNDDNVYNQNFSGLYCTCQRPYPDPDSTIEDDMIQCIVCEDWLHASHLEAVVPANDQYSEMVCKNCMEKNEFLHDYSMFAVTVETGDVDIVTVNGDAKSADTSLCNGDSEEKLVNGIEHENETTSVTVNGDVKMDEDKEKSTDEKTVDESATAEISQETKQDESSTVESSELKPEEKEKLNTDANKMDLDTESKIAKQEEQSAETETNESIKTDAPAEDSNNDKEQKETSEDKSNDKPDAAENTPTANPDQHNKTSPKKIESTDENEPAKADETKEQTETKEQMSKQSITDESGDADNRQDNKTDTGEQTEQQLLDDLTSITADNTTLEEKIDTVTEEKPVESMEQSYENKEKDEVETNKEESCQETSNDSEDKSEEKPVVVNETKTGNIEVPDTSQPEKGTKENAAEKTDSVMDAIDELLQTANPSKEEEEEIKKPSSESTDSKETTDNVETKESDVDMSASDNKLDNVPENTEDTAESNNKTITNTEDVEMSDTTTQNEPAGENKDEPKVNENKFENESADAQDKSKVTDTANESISQENLALNDDKLKTLNETDCELKTSDNNDSTIQTEPSKDGNAVVNVSESAKEHKRKLSTDLTDDISSKKAKLECVRPTEVKRIHKGATFWPSNFRQKLCTCGECLSMYKDLKVLFLTDLEDTVFAYESLGKENVAGGASQYEKGMQALSSLDRIQQINALTEYNRMRDKLLDFLKSFKDRKEIVKEEDIKAFFAGMKPRREPDGVYFCR